MLKKDIKKLIKWLVYIFIIGFTQINDIEIVN